MKKLNLIALGIILCIAWVPGVFAQGKSSESPILVGRITFIEGQLLRYVYAEKDWVATVKEAPFGLEDALYANDVGKAEFKLPNSTWARVGGDTQIQLIALREDVTEIDVAAGTARFYDKSRQAVVKATTPFGYVVAQPGTAFDLYVGDESAEVISLDGTVDFILGDGESKFTVVAGGASIISDGKRAIEGDGTVDSDWDEWNLKRERLWTQRVQVKGDSVTYLPPSLADDAYALDQHGRWERIYYQGSYRTFWRPTSVSVGWQPFTAGRWTVWNEDNTWIPEEEYGYVTHHYGNWIHANSYWYWAPPVRVKIGFLGDCACWYPGRVAWIYSDADVGWVPLAPTEIYYSHHYWGPAGVFVGGVNPAGVSINIGGLAYVNQAVIVNQSNFYGVNSYYNVRIANVNRATIINNYRAAPIVSNAVIGDYNTNRNRFVYNTNYANISAKPHQVVLQRIDHNRTVAEQHGRGISAKSVRQGAAQVRLATPLKATQGAQLIEKPRVTGKIVPENQMNRPGSEIQFQQRQLKSRESAPKVSRGRESQVRSGSVVPEVKGRKQTLSPGEKARQRERAVTRGGERPGPRGSKTGVGSEGVRKQSPVESRGQLRGERSGSRGSKTGVGPEGVRKRGPAESREQLRGERTGKSGQLREKSRAQQEHRLQRSEMQRQERLLKQQKTYNQRRFKEGQGAQRSKELRRQQQMHPRLEHRQVGPGARHPLGSRPEQNQRHP